MSALLISSAAFASGDPQTFPSSRGTIQYGNDVYISANDTNTLNQMLTGYTTNTSEAVEDALIAPNGTPYLASMAQQINNTNTEITELKSEIKKYAAQQKQDNELMAAAIENIEVSGGGGGASGGVLQEGGTPITITTTSNAHCGVFYTRNGKANTDTYSENGSYTFYADEGTEVQLVSFNGTSQNWSIYSNDTSLHLSAEGSSDRIGFVVPKEWGGFTVDNSGRLQKGFGGLYDCTMYKIKYGKLIKVNFNANGGSGTMAAQEEAVGTTVKLKANAFTRGDMDFLGWSLTPQTPNPIAGNGGKDVLAATKYKDQQNFQFLSSADGTNLYAVWGYKSGNAGINSKAGDTVLNEYYDDNGNICRDYGYDSPSVVSIIAYSSDFPGQSYNIRNMATSWSDDNHSYSALVHNANKIVITLGSQYDIYEGIRGKTNKLGRGKTITITDCSSSTSIWIGKNYNSNHWLKVSGAEYEITP